MTLRQLELLLDYIDTKSRKYYAGQCSDLLDVQKALEKMCDDYKEGK